HVKPTSWQGGIAPFFERKTPGQGLGFKTPLPRPPPTAHAHIRIKHHPLTEAPASSGIKSHLDGGLRSAYQHLEWVRDKGVRSYTEYRLALGELDRMDRARCPAALQHCSTAAPQHRSTQILCAFFSAISASSIAR